MTTFLAALFATLAFTCLALAIVASIPHMPDPADAQPDFTPLDEWAATAALDPRDGTDLPAGDDGPCEADGWVLDMYQYLERAGQ